MKKFVIDTSVIISTLFILSLVFSKIYFIPKTEYEKKLKKAKEIGDRIDPGDTPFLAVYFLIGVDGIISYDKHFDQMKIKRYLPQEILR